VARIRTIKPEFFQSEALASCTPHARLLAMALLQLCDCNGVFLNITMQVHAHAFPWEEEVKIPSLLGELQAIGYIHLYSVGGKKYGFVPGFTEHQRLSGKEAQSEGQYPLPDQADSEEKNSSLPGEASGCPGKGKRKGNKGEGNSGRFTPPSVDEVAAYCAERDNDIDPVAFVSHYETTGWMRGENKIRDWRACVRTWESRRKSDDKNPQQGIQLVSI
jgi:hypothetical protein